MFLDNFIIESTRRCNMCCDHCLRGNAQNKDISYKITETFLVKNEIESISLIMFTGGEPSLNPSAITDFITICENYNIDVGSFYIATNGKDCSDVFLLAMIKLYVFCTDNETSDLDISLGDFHCIEQNDDTIKKLKALSFTKERHYLNYTAVIPEGRGKGLNYLNGVTNNTVDIYPLEYDDNCISGEVYLNVKGDICTSCDLSYKRQDYHKIGNVFDQTLTDMMDIKEI